MKKTVLFLLCICVLSPLPSYAQQLHMTSKHWRVFTVQQGGQKLCYIASMPVDQTGNYSKRGEPFAMVTHRSSKMDEVSVSSGYPYKEKSDVSVVVDSEKYALFTDGERAWAKDSKTDTMLISSMKKGTSMTARGTSKVGSYSLDTYSLSGFTAAYNKMKSLCR